MAKKEWTGERLEPGVFNETTIEHLHRYAIAADLVAGNKVLDIACGEGYGSRLLAKTAAHVTAVDLDEQTVEEARQKYQFPNLEFRAGSIEKIPAENGSFDIVVSFETIEHIASHEKLMSEIKRVLKNDGLLIMSTPDKKIYTDVSGRKNQFHTKELYAEEFQTLLQNYFHHIQVLNQQIAFTSVITGQGLEGFTAYTGDFNEITTDHANDRLYCIALASDGFLPAIKNSLFNGRSVFAEAVTEKENIVINTKTYKLGHALLYPAKMISKLFKKK